MKRWRKKHGCKYGRLIRKIRKRAIELGQSNPGSDSNHNKKKIRKKASSYIFDRLYTPKIFKSIDEDLKKLKEERERPHLKNIILEICEFLGLSVNEVFYIELKPKDDDYNVCGDLDDVNEPIYIDEKGGIRSFYTNELLSVDLINFLEDSYKIIKLPYRPVKGDTYFSQLPVK